jgi:cell wall-associated NlpC family hydrolase
MISSTPPRLSGEPLQRVIDAAKAWIGTPYHPGARLRGIGVDCAQILVAVYSEAGFIPAIETGEYSIQVHLHQEDTQYVDTILEWAVEISESEAAPGDLVLYKVARAFAHGAIIAEWPGVIIHAMNRVGVIMSHGTEEGFLRKRPRRFFRRKQDPGNI